MYYGGCCNIGLMSGVLQRLAASKVQLIEKNQHITAGELEARFRNDIIACDFYVSHIEEGDKVVGGFRRGRILNVDHHAPVREMSRAISSTNLAIELVRANGTQRESTVLINHTDCDSILSAAIVAGVLEPEERFGEAAIVADHRGSANDIADLLQGLGPPRNVAHSLESLERLLEGEPLDDAAATALSKRRQKRERAREVVEGGAFRRIGKLAFAVLPERFDGELFPPLIPDAALLMFAAPLKEDPSRWVVKIRMGWSAPDGLDLHDLSVPEIDPTFGGRWNAGSNTRGGGTDLDPDNYASEVAARLDAAISLLTASSVKV